MLTDFLVKRVREDARLPRRVRPGDAGFDLYSAEDVTLLPGRREVVPTGIAVAIPSGWVGLIKDRSGLAAKNGIHCLAGVIDENYRGEVKVVLYNTGTEPVTLPAGSRIAQLVVVPYYPGVPKEVQELPPSNRGEEGFGSSGLA